MLADINWLAVVPVIVGAVVTLLCVWGLINRPAKSVGLIIGAVLGVALCGSSVFAKMSWDGQKFELETVQNAANGLTQIVSDTVSQLGAVQKDVANLRMQLSLLAAQPNSPGAAAASLALPKSGPWGDVKSSDFCQKWPVACNSIAMSGNSVIVPKTTIDDFTKYNEAGALDLGQSASSLSANLQKLDSIKQQLQMIAGP